ncbi:MAG: ATP-dependent RNA helicase HrpA [Pseudomonadota bacterium]|nr:ATP-dependent RNA helicase HrpA [Pseudomonadota bacterium]MDP1905206.1 ATP-dependent RNA helicase HrpA [Pseudomonadota bacterium]MDP2351100.1 ATP-dependent RNA helicase HrpA [Pseudomonadota bacterium]
MNESTLTNTPSLPHLEFPEALPVSARRDDIAAAMIAHQVIIVCGETGSGKTTQLPKIALAAGRGVEGRLVGMTQPRRIAAKSVAARIAEETKSRLGGLVGWQVRFTDQVSKDSRIKVMTDGILLAETQSDPEFRAYDTLILDEAHERSLNIDFLLGYLKTLLPRRPDLKLILSSATLEADRFSAYFNGAPVIEVSGRTYPVEMRYRSLKPLPPRGRDRGEGTDVGQSTRTPLPPRGEGDEEPDYDLALIHAVDELATAGPGDILVFLPGEREIREAHEALRKHHPPQTEILPLFARLSVSDQEKVFQSHGGRRIVLATNVAETSLTVPGIRYVVDTGLARVKRYSIRNKIEQLKVEKVAQSSANQRAGRCGRVAAGICIRLYDEQDFLARPKYTTPELLRSSLAGVILRMKSLRLPEIEAFPFLDIPEGKRIRDGQQLLAELGALDERGRLTGIGKQLARLPVDPRIGRMLIAAKDRGCLHEMLIIAAFVSVQDPRERPLEATDAADQKHRRFTHPDSDFISLLKLWAHIDELSHHRKSQKKFRDALKADFLSPNRVREWRDVYAQLTTQVKEMGWHVNESTPPNAEIRNPQSEIRNPKSEILYAPLHQALLPGLLGNLGMQTEDGAYLGARDMKFWIFPGSGVKKKPKWLLAAEIVETKRVYARMVAKIEPEWIEHAAQHLLKVSYSDPHWAKKPAHVAASMRATLYGLPIVNGRRVHYGPIDPELSRELFIRGALVEGEFETRAPWFEHNRRLLEEIDDLAHRARNARLVVDEHQLYAFFDARVPAGIHNGAAFDKWRREAEKAQPRLLYLERADLLDSGHDSQEQEFPPQLEQGGARYPLAYRFDPGTEDDGVTLIVPLAALNQITPARCEWLVPGLLQEKITALIKTLPQSLRRAFVPVPEYAKAAAAALRAPGETGNTPPFPKGGRGGISAAPTTAQRGQIPPAPLWERGASLTDALAAFLSKSTGQLIPRDAWRPEALAPHLVMNFRVQDETGKTLAEGRDLTALRQQLGSAASQELARSVGQFAGQFQRDGITKWDFGDLPDTATVESGGRIIAAFPALQCIDGQVGLRLFDHAEEARAAHRLGVARLLWLGFPDLLKQGERDLTARLKPACLQYALLFKGQSCPGLARDIMAAAVLGIQDVADIRAPAAFAAAAQTLRPRLPETVSRLANLATECIAAAHRLTQALAKAPTAWKTTVTDLREQLDTLVFPGFLASHPGERLPHLPRYLKAMEMRLAKFPNQPARDATAQRELAPLLAVWRGRVERMRAQGMNDPALDAFRWQLEELRVSLFAQELKTPEPVSVKRLEKRWAEIVG